MGSLVGLTIFFGLVTKDRMFWYESLILFLLYILYVFLMSKNEFLEKKVTACVKKCSKKDKEDKEDNEDNKKNKKKTKSRDPPIHPEPLSEEKKSTPDVAVEMTNTPDVAVEMTKTPQVDDTELEKQGLLPEELNIESQVQVENTDTVDNDASLLEKQKILSDLNIQADVVDKEKEAP